MESSLSYTLLVKCFLNALKEFLSYVDSIDLPTVRFKPGAKKFHPNRPYATQKLHSDAWVGQYGDAIISYGAYGDAESSGVEFFLPEKVSKDYLKKLDNYDFGNQLYQGLKPLGKMKIGKASVFDHSVLHRTMCEVDGGPRISIDLGIVMKCDKTLPSRNVCGADISRYNYRRMADFTDFGKKCIAFNQDSIHNIHEIISSNQLPSLTKIIDLYDN